MSGARISADEIAAQAKRLSALRTFGPSDLDRLAALSRRSDESVPLREAFERQFKRPERFLAVRHDMDHDLENALRFAQWEADNGIRASYYVLHNDWYWGTDPARPSSWVLETLDRIAALGHEIGIHNNAVATALRLGSDPALVLDRALGALRRHGFDVVGSATHGDPLCRTAGFVNNEVFEEMVRPAMGAPDREIAHAGPDGVEGRVRLHPLPMKEFGLSYEAYRIGSSMYTSDTGGRWHKPWADVHRHFDEEGAYLQVLIHPVWWALSGETLRALPDSGGAQPAAVQAPVAVRVPENAAAPTSSASSVWPAAARSEGLRDRLSIASTPAAGASARAVGEAITTTPMKILVRGDCCSRRAINMNADLFGGTPTQVRDEKCRTDFFLDHLTSGSPTAEDVAKYLQVEEMHKTLRHYAEEQITRTVLDPDDGQLIVMDSYADMNFAAWAHREKGWKMWIHPKFLRDRSAFERDFDNVGQLSLEESVEAHVRLIEHLRARNGHMPVLFFNQPVAYYAKLRNERGEFAHLGAELERRVPDLFWGEIDNKLLGPDDMNSCGPGQTLHFTGPTYRRMIASALSKGLARWMPEADRLVRETEPAAITVVPAWRPEPADATVVTATPAKGAQAAVGLAGRRDLPKPAERTEAEASATRDRRFSDRLTISFDRGDTPDPNCTSLADMLYMKFTAAHARVPGVQAYQDGCSILVLPDSYDAWLDSVSYTRRKLRRAEKLGYRFAEIDRRDHVDDIFAINTSMAERQGKPMGDAYWQRPKFGPLPSYTCSRHRMVTYGVLDSAGTLVAYTWVYQVGEMCLFSTILGHGDRLADGVMYLLIAGAIGDLIPTSRTRYAMYNMHLSGSEGLRFFKERMGFAGFFVKWRLNGERVENLAAAGAAS